MCWALDVLSVDFLPDPRLRSKPAREGSEAQRGKELAQGHVAGCPGSQGECWHPDSEGCVL